VKLSEIDFCVVDTETTGGRAMDNRIIEIAAVRYRDGIIYERFHTLINPERPIPVWITMLTGINNDMVKHAPRFSDIAPLVRGVLNRGVFTAHNAPFDHGFLKHEFLRLGEDFSGPSVCTVKLARRLLPELPSRSLGPLCQHLMIDIEDRHRALGDAEATVYVLKNLLQRLEREHNISTWKEFEAYYHSSLVKRPRSRAMRITNEKIAKPATKKTPFKANE
jgi:DNA polymerase-3 subunit epsilon